MDASTIDSEFLNYRFGLENLSTIMDCTDILMNTRKLPVSQLPVITTTINNLIEPLDDNYRLDFGLPETSDGVISNESIMETMGTKLRELYDWILEKIIALGKWIKKSFISLFNHVKKLLKSIDSNMNKLGERLYDIHTTILKKSRGKKKNLTLEISANRKYLPYLVKSGNNYLVSKEEFESILKITGLLGEVEYSKFETAFKNYIHESVSKLDIDIMSDNTAMNDDDYIRYLKALSSIIDTLFNFKTNPQELLEISKTNEHKILETPLKINGRPAFQLMIHATQQTAEDDGPLRFKVEVPTEDINSENTVLEIKDNWLFVHHPTHIDFGIFKHVMDAGYNDYTATIKAAKVNNIEKIGNLLIDTTNQLSTKLRDIKDNIDESRKPQRLLGDANVSPDDEDDLMRKYRILGKLLLGLTNLEHDLSSSLLKYYVQCFNGPQHLLIDVNQIAINLEQFFKRNEYEDLP